jgi:hypothetical protein
MIYIVFLELFTYEEKRRRCFYLFTIKTIVFDIS